MSSCHRLPNPHAFSVGRPTYRQVHSRCSIFRPRLDMWRRSRSSHSLRQSLNAMLGFCFVRVPSAADLATSLCHDARERRNDLRTDHALPNGERIMSINDFETRFPSDGIVVHKEMYASGGRRFGRRTSSSIGANVGRSISAEHAPSVQLYAFDPARPHAKIGILLGKESRPVPIPPSIEEG